MIDMRTMVEIRFPDRKNYSWMATFSDPKDAEEFKQKYEKLFPKHHGIEDVIVIEM
jgi:hypothetical protein